MSDIVAHQPNRSARRQLSLAQSKKDRKEEKKLMKNAPDSVRFNSKKSRKVVPLNPIKNSLIKKDTATIITPKKKTIDLTEIDVPVVTGKCDIEISAKMPENASEVNSFEQQENKEQVEEKKTTMQQEPPASSPPHEEEKEEEEEEEETLKEISHQSTTNEKSDVIKENLQQLSMEDKLDLVINQDEISDIKDDNNDKIMTDTSIATTVTSFPPITDESIDKKGDAETQADLVTTTITNDETNVNDTNKEIKEIKKNDQIKEKEEKTDQERVMLRKETTPAPSMTSSASISDKISPSTSTSSNKRKSSLISRLFKNKNSSKKDINLIQEPSTLNETSEQKKKPKAWKIWKKL